MRSALLLALCGVVHAGVTILTDKNWSTKGPPGNADKTFFVMFHAPWCGHCKNLAPKWDELASIIATGTEATAKEVVIAKADAAGDASRSGATYDVKGFPTLVRISAKGYYKYQNNRDIKSLQAFALEPTGHELQTLPTGWRLLLLQSNVWATAQLKQVERFAQPGDTSSQIYLGLSVAGGFVALLFLGMVVGYMTKGFVVAPLDLSCSNEGVPKMKLGLAVLDTTGSLRPGKSRADGTKDSMFYTANREGGAKDAEIPPSMNIKMVDKKND